MNTNKIVFNKLFKADLASQKVKLGLLQDIDSIYKSLQKTESEAYNLFKQFSMKVGEGQSKIGDIEKLIDKGIAQSKDLGLPSDQFNDKKAALSRLSASLNKMSKLKI